MLLASGQFPDDVHGEDELKIRQSLKSVTAALSLETGTPEVNLSSAATCRAVNQSAISD